MLECEGSELNFYCNGKSYSIPLTDIQFGAVLKILGLTVNEKTGEITCFSDEGIVKLAKMKGNPLRLEEI